MGLDEGGIADGGSTDLGQQFPSVVDDRGRGQFPAASLLGSHAFGADLALLLGEALLAGLCAGQAAQA